VRAAGVITCAILLLGNMPAAAAPGPSPTAPEEDDAPRAPSPRDRTSDAERPPGSGRWTPEGSASENWLLDAASPRAGRAPESLHDLIREAREEGRPRGKQTNARSRAPEPVPNPFAGYLAEWMTSDDYTLLVAGSREKADGSGIAAARVRPPAARALGAPGEQNPFVTAQEKLETTAKTVSAPVVAPSVAPTAPAPRLAAPLDAAGVIPPEPEPRGSWQPSGAAEEKKYFPQLNRF